MKTRSQKTPAKQKKAQSRTAQKAKAKTRAKPKAKTASRRKGRPEKASIKEIAGKVVKTVKQIVEKVKGKKLPFGGKVGRKKKTVISETAQQELARLHEDELLDRLEQSRTEVGRSDPAVDFFYTQDKFINQFDDVEIFAYVRRKYPEFMRSGDSETKVRRSIQHMLEDQEFVHEVMKLFDITVFDLFKIFFRADPAVFKKPFLQALHKQIARKSYYPKDRC